MGHCGLTIFFYNVFGRCPLLGQPFFYSVQYYSTVYVALLSAAVVAAAAAGCLRVAAAPLIFF